MQNYINEIKENVSQFLGGVSVDKLPPNTDKINPMASSKIPTEKIEKIKEAIEKILKEQTKDDKTKPDNSRLPKPTKEDLEKIKITIKSPTSNDGMPMPSSNKKPRIHDIVAGPVATKPGSLKNKRISDMTQKKSQISKFAGKTDNIAQLTKEAGNLAKEAAGKLTGQQKNSPTKSQRDEGR